MYDTMVPLMRCTACHQELNIASVQEASASDEIVEGVVACPADHTWPVEGGILVFTRADAPAIPGPGPAPSTRSTAGIKKHGFPRLSVR